MWNVISCKSQYQEYLAERHKKCHQKHLDDIKFNSKNPMNKPISQPNRKPTDRCKGNNLRTLEIGFENRALIKRMLKIDLNTKKPTKNSNSNNSVKSLNWPLRQQFQVSVQNSNKKILKKLRKTESVYTIAKWNKSSKFHQYIRNNISRNSGRLTQKRPEKKLQVLNLSYSLDSFPEKP